LFTNFFYAITIHLYGTQLYHKNEERENIFLLEEMLFPSLRLFFSSVAIKSYKTYTMVAFPLLVSSPYSRTVKNLFRRGWPVCATVKRAAITPKAHEIANY
jgi:hypothetical protein